MLSFLKISNNTGNLEMEEYCNHCAQKHGMQNSFVGLAPQGKTANVFCKGCGITHVNHLGECLKCKYKSSFVTFAQSKSFLLVIILGATFASILSIYTFQ